MRVHVPLGSSSSSSAAAAAAAGACLIAAASRPDVTVSVSYPGVAQQQQQFVAAETHAFKAAAAACSTKGGVEVHIKYKCGPSPDVVQFYLWLYGDACMAQPLEVWQVRAADTAGHAGCVGKEAAAHCYKRTAGNAA